MNKLSGIIIASCAFFGAPAYATDVPNCTSVVPEECLDTTLAIRVQSGASFTDAVTGLAGNQTVTAEVIADVRDPQIQGWSWAVTHDTTELTLDTVSATGVAAEFTGADFNITRAGTNGSGLFQALVLRFSTIAEVTAGLARRVAAMTYTTSATFIGPTEIIFEDGVVRPAGTSPPVANVMTVDGASRACRKVQTALVD